MAAAAAAAAAAGVVVETVADRRPWINATYWSLVLELAAWLQ